MKPHDILKDFHGSQTGHDNHHFAAGTVADLSRDLADVVVKHGWAKPVETSPHTRETKVVGPQETKVVEPAERKDLDAMNFKELVEEAKAKGVKTFGMSEEKLRAALTA